MVSSASIAVCPRATGCDVIDSALRGYGSVGAVVGATYPEQLVELREAMPHTWFLVPGFGAQGATARDVAGAFDGDGLGAIVNSSRGIIFAHSRDAYRERLGADTHKILFDLVQLGLALLTVLALTQLFSAVQQGLLGTPQMQIAGNQSTAYQLNWYQDRIGSELPQAWVLSVPLWVYRTLMLVWALWLAFALLGWLRWGWTCFSTHGLWRELKRRPAAS